MLQNCPTVGRCQRLMPPPPAAASPPRPRSLSPEAARLIEEAFADMEGQTPVDYHVHMLGLGAGGTGARANPKLLSWRHPLSRLKAKIIFKSSGIASEARADQQYLARLLAMAKEFPRPVRLAILAFDYHYAKDGAIDHGKSEFYLPSEYVIALARRHPELFIPVVSVHPYAADALKRLERYAEAGGRMIKWLPNAQGIDPSDPDIKPFYRLMRDFGMVLLCHTGQEASVASGAQQFGNPLLLRRPLDLGLTVLMAHAGNRGRNEDLDHPGRRARNFDLALRLLDDPNYRDRLFADISTITQTLRSHNDLKILLERSDLHHRLVNGSDYPLPGVNFFIQPWRLQRSGFITGPQRRCLGEIYRQNPLLFDFVLKRTLRHPQTGARFPPGLFVAHPGIAGNNPSAPTTTRTAQGA